VNKWLKAKLLRLAYIPASSERYNHTKHYFHRLLNDETFPQNRYFDSFMVVLVIASSIEYVYEVGTKTGGVLNYFEELAIAIFAMEYIIRFWVTGNTYKLYISMYEEAIELRQELSLFHFFWVAIKQKFLFMIQPMNIVDLLAIHPELRPIRLLKLFRYFDNSRYLLSVFYEKKYELSLLSMIVGVTIFISSALFYEVEYSNGKLQNYFDSIYWSVITVGTVGYGDITPNTTLGKAISIILVFVGLGVLAMFTSIITTGLEKKIHETKEKDNFRALSKLDDHVIIVGYGKVGADLAAKLKHSGDTYVVIDNDMAAVEEARRAGINAYLFDGTHSNTYHSLGLKSRAKAVLALTGSDLANTSIVLTVRSISRVVFVVAKANDMQNKSKFFLAKANQVVSRRIGAQMLSQFVNAPIAFDAISELIHGDKKIMVEEITITRVLNEKGHIDTEALELESYGVLVLGVHRYSDFTNGEFHFNPAKNELILKEKDILIVAGRSKNIEGLKLKIKNECIS
jgi:voltage-gated potassium channel